MDYFVGTRPNSFAEFVLPPTWRARWMALGNRLTRHATVDEARGCELAGNNPCAREIAIAALKTAKPEPDPPLETKVSHTAESIADRVIHTSSTLRSTLTRRRK